MQTTLYDKILTQHTIRQDGDNLLLYIDRHFIHEVTSPQAFEGLKLNHRKPWRIQSVVATADHNTPTNNWHLPIADEDSRIQVNALDENIRRFGAQMYTPFRDPRQGIVHVLGPELGATLPGMTVVCGDSHTSTHGALGCLAFGIGTSEVEHVLATQCLTQTRSANSRLYFTGKLQPGVYAKDVVLYFIGKLGTAWGRSQVLEYAGPAISAMSIEERMTICNMSIEGGAKAGLVAVDDTTLNYVAGKPLAPKGKMWDKAEAYWRTLHSDEGAPFREDITIDASLIEPQVTWGTSPDMVLPISGQVPDPAQIADSQRKTAVIRALEYMNLKPGTPLDSIEVDKVFIGSCTNSRLEDLRIAASVLKGRKRAASLKQVLVVPGSGTVKKQAEAEGLHRIFLEAGCEWREPGCSMCLGMNEDRLSPGERCASTSNRNYEGRQGPGGRTHLMSPAMAAATIITGHLTDVRSLLRP